ncbi:hypothetical protein SUGI_0316540 [Cryptomeria japonica]|nr:hypothetical protein SUGI_0316540 [Cryptomeria japonica]
MAILDHSGECALAKRGLRILAMTSLQVRRMHSLAKRGLRILAMPSLQAVRHGFGVSVARSPPAHRLRRFPDCGVGISTLGSNVVPLPPPFGLAKAHQARL